MSRVGEKLKEAREKSGLTQKALAKKLGVAEKYINEIELGRKVAQESLIERAGKILKVDLNDISMVVTDEDLMKERIEESSSPVKKVEQTKPKVKARILGETSDVWTDAFSSVLKDVKIYDYSLKNVYGTKQLPIHSNKIEGIASDKAVYIKVADNDMSGFRLLKDDLVFGYLTKEINKSGYYLVEYNNKKAIRQIKLLNNSKALVLSNAGSVLTETIDLKSIKIIAKLTRAEIQL